LREEIDIQVDIERLLKSVFHRYEWGAVRIDGYLCRYAGGSIKHLEVADHAWVPFDQLDSYKILPADQAFVDWLKHNGKQEQWMALRELNEHQINDLV
jgi:8-oxo-dGTP diphosphatase